MKPFIAIFLLLQVFLLSAQDQLVLESNLVPGNDTVWVIKPSSYDTSAPYPAVYLLHGRTGNYRSWAELINLQEYADEYQFIIICPDGFYDSYYLDSPVDTSWQFESFFTEVLYPEMAGLYALDKARIFITGLSMGGSGAMYLFLKHPALFLSAGSSSGVMDLNHSSAVHTSLSRLLDSHSPVNQLKNIERSDKHIFFDCGTEDHLYECNNAFRKKCDELKIKATYISRPGKHEGAYWKESIRCHFIFFSNL
jgi:putative tributyrin esterase